MTDDFKNTLLKYFTGNLDIQTQPYGTQIPFELISTNENNFETLLSEKYPNGYELVPIQKTATIKSTNDINVTWGNYTDTDNVKKGFVMLLSSNGDVLQVIDTYDSGIKIGYIYELAVEEDGEFYGIIKGNDFATPYLTLLNNITVKRSEDAEYQIKRRISYNIGLPSSLSYVSFLEKNNSYYLVSADTYLKLIKLEVGEENKIINVTAQGTEVENLTLASMTYEENKITIEAKRFDTKTGTFYLYSGVYNDNETTTSLVLISKKQVIVDSEKTILIYSMAQRGGNTYLTITKNLKTYPEKDYRLEIYRLKNNSELEYLIGYTQEHYYGTTIMRCWLYNAGGVITLYLTNPNSDTQPTHVKSIGLINEEDENKPFIYEYTTEIEAGLRDEGIISFATNYNLLKANIYIDNKSKNYQTIYNRINYNGNEYNGATCMVPNYGNIYASDTYPVFSRNLYNKTISGNTTTSTIEVPNLYLNDIELKKQELFSKTNKEIAISNKSITKNIYEKLFINFINTISIKDNNYTSIDRTQGAIGLNTEISTELLNKKIANKYRIIYRLKDEVTKEFTKDQIQMLTDDTAMYEFAIFADEEINRIEIISNDELETYAEIDGGRLEVGRLYNITQYVEIN